MPVKFQKGCTMTERKYQFRAMLIDPDDPARAALAQRTWLMTLEELSGPIVDEYTFSAVSNQGAKRAASEWYNRIHPEARLLASAPGSPTDWQFLGVVEENRHFRLTPSGLVLALIPLGSQESEAAVEEMMALMARVRRDPSAVREQYLADDLLNRLERYFRHCLDEVGGEITDQVRRDADRVYDWPNAPTMLARALDCTPAQVRKLLGKLRHLRCPGCQETFVVIDERRQGGFTVETYYCTRCQENLVEYQLDYPGRRSDWRQPEPQGKPPRENSPPGQFNRGDRLVFIEMVKINLVDGTVVNIPAGTIGVITDVAEGEMPLYTIRCNPATTHLEPSFRVSADEEAFLGKVALAGEVDITAIPGLNEQDLYDDDMPGFMRSDSGYLISEEPDDPYLAAEHLLFKRTPWTDWQIEVRFYAGGNNIDEVTGVFRTTWREGQECEQFTLLPQEHDYTYVQVQIFSASRVRCYAHVPAEVEINTRKKLVTIYLLCRVEFTETGIRVHELLD